MKLRRMFTMFPNLQGELSIHENVHPPRHLSRHRDGFNYPEYANDAHRPSYTQPTERSAQVDTTCNLILGFEYTELFLFFVCW